MVVSLARPASAGDILIDGVPLPADAPSIAGATAAAPPSPWLGAWTGAWDGVLKHILVVESVAADGDARVIYAYGDNSAFGVTPGWVRRNGKVQGQMLTIDSPVAAIAYNLTGATSLRGTYTRGGNVSSAVLARANFSELIKPDAKVAWTPGLSEMAATDIVEDGKPVRLEIKLFKPAGAGPFPLAIVNHGSTGDGKSPAVFTQTWVAYDLAMALNERGYLVAFPHRRGRGRSDGLYDEGFAVDRTKGYTCDTDISLGGANRALGDLDAAIAALRRRSDVTAAPVLLAGQSRGGILAMAYAGAHPDQIAGVINFVGGWMGEGCPTASQINRTLFKQGAQYTKPTLWLYGNGDPFYSISHSRANFAAFQSAGGQGTFLEFDVPGGFGHNVIGNPGLWSTPVKDYLRALQASGTK